MSGRLARERIDIERLVVWALVEQGQGFAGREVQREDWTDYGGEIDLSPVRGLPSMGLLSDDDAVAVRHGIGGLPHEMGALVLQYGRASSRPDWAPEGYGEPEQMRNRRGQLMWDYERPGNRRSKRTPRLDHWAHARRKASVDFFRATWALWWRGLELLVPAVNNTMETHLAIGPAVAKAPWLKPLDGPLPASAAERLRRYAERDGFEDDAILGGQVTLDEVRAAAQAPVSDMATVLTTETSSGVEAVFKRDRVAEVGREAIERKLTEENVDG